MALPAGRYGVTFEQLRKIRKLPVNTIEMINDTQEATARVENGTKPEVAINAGEQFWHGSVLYTATANISTSDTIITSGEGANCTPSDPITEQLSDKLNTYTSDPTQWDTSPTASSTKPVTSGGEYNTAVGGYQLVKDTVGWTGKNLWREPFRAQVIDGSGNITDNSSMKLTDYIDIGDITELYATWASKTGTVTVRINSYTSAKVFINRIVSSDNNHVFTLPENTKYIRINIEDNPSSYLTDFMLCNNRLVNKSYEVGHAPVSEQKCDNSVIAPVENGDNASQAYNAGDPFIRNGKFCTFTVGVAQGDALVGKYTEGNVADKFKVIESTASLLTNSIGVTLDSTVKYVRRCGNIVEFLVRFSVTSTVSVTALTGIISLGYASVIDGYKITITKRVAPYTPITGFALNLSANGNLSIPRDIELEAGTYDISGMYITK